MSERIDPGLPEVFDLEQLRKQAKELKKAVRAGDARAIEQMARSHPKYAGRARHRLSPEQLTLRDAQATLARELGFAGWKEFLEAVEQGGSGKLGRRWSRSADFPLLRRAFVQAEAVGLGVCGPEELLLALLDPPERRGAIPIAARVPRFAKWWRGPVATGAGES